MSRSKLIRAGTLIILSFSLALFLSSVPQIAHTIQIALAQSGYVWADGYYDGGMYVLGGARSDMESGDPAVRAGGTFSAMRVAVAHDQLSNPNSDGAFVEIGWIKAPGVLGNGRFVYAAWQPTVGSYDQKIILKLATGDWSAHDYRVAVKNDNQTQWSFMFDGTVKHTIAPGFSRGAEVGCGGEANSPQNAIGAAACWNVRYKNNNLTSWVGLPWHFKRVSSGYQVYDYSTYSWQSSGNN